MEMIKLNDKGETVVKIQEALGLISDGNFGPNTERAVKEFQTKKGLTADGIVGPKTLELMLGTAPVVESPVAVTKLGITEEQYKAAAALIGCEVAVIKAVDMVESTGGGFLNGDVKILFEPHIFWRQLRMNGINPVNKTKGYEDVLYENWKSGAYGPYSQQWNRLNKAAKINEKSALEAASYGKFQILGSNFKAAGFKDVFEMVKAMRESEYNHLVAFVSFVKANNLSKHLVNKNWELFAKGYNGGSYKTNKYDTKLAEAYKKFK